eukprot:TRINITY_DN4044_c0_g1_i1.p1 TRINITY_DN4044_c0_g1~~TRINITY_DN4044_c0_g1_i1.p1  ORF type:complete len:851 (+),score=217.97 TRINITY_DN4044_c0_g1_i1:56-2554(+)
MAEPPSAFDGSADHESGSSLGDLEAACMEVLREAEERLQSEERRRDAWERARADRERSLSAERQCPSPVDDPRQPTGDSLAMPPREGSGEAAAVPEPISFRVRDLRRPKADDQRSSVSTEPWVPEDPPRAGRCVRDSRDFEQAAAAHSAKDGDEDALLCGTLSAVSPVTDIHVGASGVSSLPPGADWRIAASDTSPGETSLQAAVAAVTLPPSEQRAGTGGSESSTRTDTLGGGCSVFCCADLGSERHNLALTLPRNASAAYLCRFFARAMADEATALDRHDVAASWEYGCDVQIWCEDSMQWEVLQDPVALQPDSQVFCTPLEGDRRTVPDQSTRALWGWAGPPLVAGQSDWRAERGPLSPVSTSPHRLQPSLPREPHTASPPHPCSQQQLVAPAQPPRTSKRPSQIQAPRSRSSSRSPLFAGQSRLSVRRASDFADGDDTRLRTLASVAVSSFTASEDWKGSQGAPSERCSPAHTSADLGLHSRPRRGSTGISDDASTGSAVDESAVQLHAYAHMISMQQQYIAQLQRSLAGTPAREHSPSDASGVIAQAEAMTSASRGRMSAASPLPCAQIVITHVSDSDTPLPSPPPTPPASAVPTPPPTAVQPPLTVPTPPPTAVQPPLTVPTPPSNAVLPVSAPATAVQPPLPVPTPPPLALPTPPPLPLPSPHLPTPPPLPLTGPPSPARGPLPTVRLPLPPAPSPLACFLRVPNPRSCALSGAAHLYRPRVLALDADRGELSISCRGASDGAVLLRVGELTHFARLTDARDPLSAAGTAAFAATPDSVHVFFDAEDGSSSVEEWLQYVRSALPHIHTAPGSPPRACESESVSAS